MGDLKNAQLREALTRAEDAIADALGCLDDVAQGDALAGVGITAAEAIVRRWRVSLEAGDWPGRSSAFDD